VRRALIVVFVASWLVAGFSRADEEPKGPPPPKASKLSYRYDVFRQAVARPIARTLDPALLSRKISHHEREAANVDESDRVRLPSTWWQPRVGFVPVSVEQMLQGPGPGTGPSREKKWKVTGLKTEGVSLGFRIKDATGTTFQIKFDPKGYPELATGADVAATYLFWAAGYNVPDNAIVNFTVDDLEIPSDASYEDAMGRKHPLDRPRMEQLLAGAPRGPDSTYRAVASRYLKGKPLGEWVYSGRRLDDPEDLVPHEMRRELRGLWTLAAWIHHDDASARNTLDMWVTDGGRSFVRHHLIDFSSCLGSASIAAHPLRSGHEYVVDYHAAGRALATAGLYRPRWEFGQDPHLPAAGYLETETFDPDSWRPFLPNPAFDARTERDIRWGARIVIGFTEEMIRAAVERGRYSDPRVTEYLVRALMERREKLVHRWLPDGTASR
jgi:hypothetical protein